MKLPRLRTLAAAGTVAGTLAGAVMLTAPQASAMPNNQFIAGCRSGGGQIGIATHYDFDEYGTVVDTSHVAVCNYGGGNVEWNDTDVDGLPYG